MEVAVILLTLMVGATGGFTTWKIFQEIENILYFSGHHLDAVADAVLPVEVLHRTDHAGQVLRHGGDQQGAVIEDLRGEMRLLEVKCPNLITNRQWK